MKTLEQDTPRKARAKKKGPKWATDDNIKRYIEIQPEPEPEPKEAPPTMAELRRRELVRARNEARRVPWLAAAGTACTCLIGSGMAALMETAGVTATSVAWVMASIPAVATITGWAKVYYGLKRAYRRFARNVAIGGTISTALVWWVTVAGWNWWHLAVLLAGTMATGFSWWREHPVGPGVPALEVPEPKRAPADELPALEPATETPTEPEVDPEPDDEFTTAWSSFVANKNGGKVPGAILTNRVTDEFTITYDVDLVRGQQTLKHLNANAEEIAGGLGLPREDIFFEKRGRKEGEHKARLTIITKDPVAETRLYTGPQVENGIIKNIARYKDGKGEASIRMWNRDGMIPTSIMGGTGGGKSAAANILTCGALDSGVMNLIYIDPKGNSSTALRNVARIAIIGQENALRAPELVQQIIKARVDYSSLAGRDKLIPTAELPGWMHLHDEFSLVQGDSKTVRMHREQVNIVRSLGLWYVALNQVMHQSKWGDDQIRSAYAKQAVAFYIASLSGSNLMPGFEYNPSQLPLDDEGQPVPGMAVHANTKRANVPCRWDWLPSDDEEGIDAPYRTSEAFAAFDKQPPVPDMDYKAICSVLGEPNDEGRWVIGPGGTHSFPELDGSAALLPAPARSSGWGHIDSGPESNLSRVAQQTLKVVRGGTTQAGDIEEAVTAARSTIRKALDELVAQGLVVKPERGKFVAVDQ